MTVHRIIHRNEREPNAALPGYFHVSAYGPYRSTLVNQFRNPSPLSKRQQRKHNKAVNRAIREAGE